MQPPKDANENGPGGRCPLPVAACVPAVDNHHSTVNHDTIRVTINKALVERSSLPRYEDLKGLYEVLLKQIETLLPLAQKRVDGLRRGSSEWYTKQSRLGSIPHQMKMGLGPGLQSAACRVRSLGYTLQFLWENSGLPEAEEDARS
jgi:hypothetical protein